jgi:hypothetical protein
MVCRDRLDKIKKEEEERQEHDAKAHHDLLLKAYAEASAARPSDAQCFDDAMQNKDVAQAQSVNCNAIAKELLMLRVLQMLLCECWRAGCWCRAVFGKVRVPVRRQQRNARYRGCWWR